MLVAKEHGRLIQSKYKMVSLLCEKNKLTLAFGSIKSYTDTELILWWQLDRFQRAKLPNQRKWRTFQVLSFYFRKKKVKQAKRESSFKLKICCNLAFKQTKIHIFFPSVLIKHFIRKILRWAICLTLFLYTVHFNKQHYFHKLPVQFPCH